MAKEIPEFKTDEELEAFIEGDLSNLDFSKLRPVHFEFAKKTRPGEYAAAGNVAGRGEGAVIGQGHTVSKVYPRSDRTGHQRQRSVTDSGKELR